MPSLMEPGQALLHVSIWAALLLYFLAVWLMLRKRDAAARLAWSAACLAYLLHVAAAFHYVHGWSHAHAYEDTAQRSGFGPGIYVSYLFTLVWSADVLSWWLAPGARRRRPWWIEAALHAFLAFILFNGAVIFAEGPVRWVSLVLFSFLLLALFPKKWS